MNVIRYDWKNWRRSRNRPTSDDRRAGAARDQQLTLVARELRDQPIGVQVEPHYRPASSRARSAGGTSAIDADALICSARR